VLWNVRFVPKADIRLLRPHFRRVDWEGASRGPSLRKKLIDAARRLRKGALSLQVRAGRRDAIALGIENRDPITVVALVVKFLLSHHYWELKRTVTRTVLKELRGPMLHSGELIFAFAFVNVPRPWLRLFVGLRRQFAR
jgi:hypothetical protein